jgi:Protein of unknown function (DUF1579)
MQPVQPQKEHQWLHRLVGEWTFENDCIMEPGKPPLKSSGTDSVRSYGGIWVICEGEGEIPGGGVSKAIMTLGYDPARKRFVGSFIASVMSNLWVYEGTLAGNVLTLDCEGPSFTQEGATAKYQDIIEIVSDAHRTLASQVLVDGKWNRFMTAHYRRKK